MADTDPQPILQVTLSHTQVKNAVRDLLINEMGVDRNKMRQMAQDIIRETLESNINTLIEKAHERGELTTALRSFIMREKRWDIDKAIASESAKVAQAIVAKHITITPHANQQLTDEDVSNTSIHQLDEIYDDILYLEIKAKTPDNEEIFTDLLTKIKKFKNS
jgi:hypothetical protein